MRGKISTILLIFFCAAGQGCSEHSFKGQGTGQSNSADEAGGGAGKPSDDSEGVPGYLTSPDDVQAIASGSGLGVKGGAGSVAAAPGIAVSDLVVAYWDVTLAAFDAARLANGALAGKLLGTAPVGGQGDFAFSTGKLDGQDGLVLTVARRGVTPRLVAPALGSGRYAAAVLRNTAASGTFEGVAVGNAALAVNLGKILGTPLTAEFAVARCLGALYGANGDVSQLGAYRLLSPSGTAVTDSDSGKPEVVHVLLNGLAVNGLALTLQNPRATYCLDMHALSFINTTITVDCHAKFFDGSASLLGRGVDVKTSGGC